MKKKLSLLLAAVLCLILLPLAAKPAYAGDYDEILSYDVEVVPDTADGSLLITMRFDWKALETLQHGTELKIGIPNGSIRSLQKLTDNIESIDYDNSYMYVYMDRTYQSNESFTFAFSWVQEYMYTLGSDGSVSYDYTPGWFDEARIDRMSVRWVSPANVGGSFSWSGSEQGKWSLNGDTLSAADLGHGSAINLRLDYTNWPTPLSWEGSSENLPSEEWDDDWDDGSGDAFIIFFVLFLVIVVCIIVAAARVDDGYHGGFGTVHHTYIYTGGLWYPAGPDHKPIPGSVGLAKKPAAPKTGSSNHKSGGGFGGGGFGGGSRGGGFGGGGFSGGSRCACASSCACACACACAGGGRAGCSAKNLYGAVKLDRELTRAMGAEEHEEL